MQAELPLKGEKQVVPAHSGAMYQQKAEQAENAEQEAQQVTQDKAGSAPHVIAAETAVSETQATSEAEVAEVAAT